MTYGDEKRETARIVNTLQYLPSALSFSLRNVKLFHLVSLGI